MTVSNSAPAPAVETRFAQVWGEITGWVVNHAGDIAVSAALSALIVAVLMGAKWFGRRLCRPEPGANHWRIIIGRALSRIRLWFMIAAAAQIVSVYAHAPADIAKTIYFLFVVAATLQAAICARELVIGIVEHRAGEAGASPTLGSAIGIIRLLVSIALFAIAVVVILSNLGVNVTGLVAGLGIGGIAIGLAAQGIFRDLFAALSILFDKPFRVGEIIKFGDATGRVEAIGLKTTRVRSLDGELVIMSNDKLLDMQLRNLAGIAERRVVLTLPLQYGNEPDALERLPERLKALVEATKHCRFDHAWLTEFKTESVSLELMFHVTRGEAEARDRARHQVMLKTLACLRELGIDLQYPGPPPEVAR